MAIVNGSLQSGYKDSAWFTANPTVVLKEGQIVYLEQTGTYKLGDGVTQLSALTFLGGGGTVDVNTIGAAINGATSATPNDTDFVMSVDTSVAKKNTWTQIKAFLKTYFDTVYATITDLTGYVKKGTLTTNYIPKATASDTIGNSQIIDNGTNIGINTTPHASAKFYILGNDSSGISLRTESTGSSWGGGISINNGVKNHFIAQGGSDYNNSLFFISNTNTYITQLDESGNFRLGYAAAAAIDSITARLYVKGIDNTSSNYNLKLVDNSLNNLLSVRNDGLINVGGLTASQIVETDSSKNLVSAAKGTAYNKNFGTGTTNVVEIGSTLSNSEITSTDANGKLQTLSTATYPSLTELSYLKSTTSSVQTQIDAKASNLLGKINVNIAHTGTVNETILNPSTPISGFDTNDFIKFMGGFSGTNNANTKIFRIYVNTSHAIGGTLLATYSMAGSASGGAPFNRNLFFKNSLSAQGVYSTTTSLLNDELAVTNTNDSSLTYDFSGTNYIVITCQLASAADTANIKWFRIQRFR